MKCKWLPWLLVLTFVGAGCASSKKVEADESKAAKADQTDDKSPTHLSVALSFDPETLDPGMASGAPESRVIFNLFEGLLAPAQSTTGAASVDDLVEPGVAKSYRVSDDGKTYTFELRKDARWSNGEPVTAHDFVFAWKRILTPDSSADYAAMLDVIKGAKSFRKGRTEEWSTVGVQAKDAHTLVVELVNPTPQFPEMVSFYTFFPVPRKVVEEHGASWTEAENIVSNGAYVLTNRARRMYIEARRNRAYWDHADVPIDLVTFRIMTDRQAALNAFDAGEIDWVGLIPKAIRGERDGVFSHPLLGTYFLRVNVRARNGASPLEEPKVRHALSLAIDRQKLLQRAGQTEHSPAHSLVPPHMPGYTPVSVIEHDPDTARRLLEEAGYPGGEGMPKLTYLFNTDEGHKRIAEALQKIWKDELGVEVELVNREWKLYLQAVDEGDYDIARAGWIGDYSGPLTFLDMLGSQHSSNDTGWSNKKYDALLSKAKASATPSVQAESYRKAEEILLREAPVIPLYFYSIYEAVSPKVLGIEEHSRDIHLIKYMSMDESKSLE